MWSRVCSQFTRCTASTDPSQRLPTSALPPHQDQNMETIPPRGGAPTHLLILVNGLFGSRLNWNYISQVLHEHLDTRTILIYVSKANEYAATYKGIDTCGSALAAEISSLVATTPSLERISFIGHSMGGLIARYAAGELYDIKNGCIATLKPSHYIALATPHLGCEPNDASPAQIPIVSWLQPHIRLPFGFHNLPARISPAIASTAFRRTGRQFFLKDEIAFDSSKTTNTRDKTVTSESQLPLLYRLSQDCPSENRYFWSALASFETRTAYANSSGDYFVGWANSSVRDVFELPKFPPGTKGRGVVREDPLEMAWAPESRPAIEKFGDLVGLDPGHGHVAESVTDILDATSAQDLISKEKKESNASEIEINAGGSTLRAESTPEVLDTVGADPSSRSRSELIRASLASLQRLQWRRIDVCFAGGALPLLAHQHMQVQRRWVNSVGKATAKHLALQLAAMEEIRQGSSGAAAAVPAVRETNEVNN